MPPPASSQLRIGCPPGVCLELSPPRPPPHSTPLPQGYCRQASFTMNAVLKLKSNRTHAFVNLYPTQFILSYYVYRYNYCIYKVLRCHKFYRSIIISWEQEAFSWAACWPRRLSSSRTVLRGQVYYSLLDILSQRLLNLDFSYWLAWCCVCVHYTVFKAYLAFQLLSCHCKPPWLAVHLSFFNIS